MTTDPHTSRETEMTIVDRVVQAVAELPDRTSPEEWPEAMLVTGDELRMILDRELSAPSSATATPQEKSCINCSLEFQPADARGYFGSPRAQVGPLCTMCYELVKRHASAAEPSQAIVAARWQCLNCAVRVVVPHDDPTCDCTMSRFHAWRSVKAASPSLATPRAAGEALRRAEGFLERHALAYADEVNPDRLEPAVERSDG